MSTPTTTIEASRTPSERWTIVGAEGPRLDAWRSAAERIGRPAPRFVSYVELAARPERARALRGPVRFESYGRDLESQVCFHLRGSREHDEALDERELRDALSDRGRIVAPRRLHVGWMSVLQEIADAAPEASFLQQPDEIALAYDKPRCQARLSDAGVPVPRMIGSIAGWEDLVSRMDASRCARVFVKLDLGASGAGAIAIARRPGAVVAHTATELADGRLYSTRRVRALHDEREVARLVDAVAGLGAFAEVWFPKATLDGGPCDLRVVTIHGRARHVVLRRARGPFTNLHVGAERDDPQRLEALLPPGTFAAMRDSVERAARVFPRSAALGIDVALDRAGRHAVLEVNAFGDFVRGALDDRGRSPQELELAC